MFTIYGIKNCDTVKKALRILDKNGATYQFVDFKTAGVTSKQVLAWKKKLGQWPINKRGTTFRKFKDKWESGDDETKLMLIVNNSSLIKRPVLENQNGEVMVGLDTDYYEKLI